MAGDRPRRIAHEIPYFFKGGRFMGLGGSARPMQGVTVRPAEAGGAEGLTRVGEYKRRLGTPWARLLENALDWEHLPWVHSSSFSSIECLKSGAWGWRARVELPPTAEPQEILLELLLDRDKRTWVSRTLEGRGAGAEIWTAARPAPERQVDVHVDFFLPRVASPEKAASYGAAYARLYERLYDEDEGMMVGRQQQLDRLKSKTGSGRQMLPKPVDLGTVDEVRGRLPFCFEFGGDPFRLVEYQGVLVAHSTVCTHLLGPLEHCEVEKEGVLTCPWHGCRFDVATGTAADASPYHLAPPPRVSVDRTTSRVTAEGAG